MEEKDIEQQEAGAKADETAQTVENQEQEASKQPEVESRADRRAKKKGLEEENEKLRQQLGETNDKYVRLMAEFDNFRRRTAKERLDLIETAGKDILVGFLPVVDDLERALKMLRESGADASAIEGTELIYNKLFSFLTSKGLKKIEAVGKDFDTDFHEAVAQFPAPQPEMKNKIIDVTMDGYLLGEKVVRYAKVVVGI